MSPPSPNPQFFTQDWTITLPTHPHLRFIRLHPGNHAAWLDVESHPDNNIAPGWPGQDVVWTDERKRETKERFGEKWRGFRERGNGFDVLVVEDVEGQEERALGNGQAHEVKPGMANIGLELLADARRKGVGKALFTVLLRLSNELAVEGLQVQAGTMKGNSAMRGLAKSMGFEESEEVVEVPGRGVVAEICWNGIKKEEWLGLEWSVEFKELVLE